MMYIYCYISAITDLGMIICIILPQLDKTIRNCITFFALLRIL